MPTFPVRRLGSAGVVPDVYPADLENFSAFTGGVNVRFNNGRAARAPVFRAVTDLTHEPGHILAIPPNASGYEEVITVAADFGSMYRLNGTTLESVTPAGQMPLAGTQVITSGFLGGVAYLNRETQEPLVKRPTDDTFLTLPNWPAGDRCRVLRPYKDQLVALGVTKSGTMYPTMVRWSDFAYFGDVPGSWDPGDPTKSAGENIVNGMKHELVDGATLRDSFILYCTGSVWLMDYVGGNDIFQFRKLFDDRGVINPNCVVQVGGMHYVFDRNDIYVHDGVTDRSICDGKTKKFIFAALDFSKVNLCWAHHDPKVSEVRFAYCSDDVYTGFKNPTTGCNRQAVYNYSNDTWTFYDIPNLVACTQAALLSGDNWETDQEAVWDTAGGAWMTAQGDMDRHILVAGRSDADMGITAPRVYGHDLLNGGRLPLPVNLETIKPAVLERTGIDLDSLGKRLTQHVNIQAVWPQIRMDNPSDCFWEFGGNNLVGVDPSWSPPQTFDPATESKIDVNESGKYLAYRFTCNGQQDFDLSGFDIQLLVRGRR
jgi:hypothetical protein